MNAGEWTLTPVEWQYCAHRLLARNWKFETIVMFSDKQLVLLNNYLDHLPHTDYFH